MERIWANLSELTQFAVVIISLIAVGFHVRWTRRNTMLGPTFLTTLGIFFCLTGIAWGLLNFDPGDIRSSIPHLLEGIRTSFWASVVGIFWALTLKGRVALMGDAAGGDFGEHAAAAMALAQYRCTRCGIDLSAAQLRRFLHVHHREVVKYDNPPSELVVMCIGCHANQCGHGLMRALLDFSEFSVLARG